MKKQAGYEYKSIIAKKTWLNALKKWTENYEYKSMELAQA